MVTGMAGTRKVTVTLPESSVAAVKGLVESGAAGSVSAFVAHAVALALDDVSGWQGLLHDALAETGGEPTAREVEWADHVLAGPTAPHDSSAVA